VAVIRVTDVSKCFRLRPGQSRSFQDLLVNAFRGRTLPRTDETLWALKDVTFAVEAGETLGIMGPNGSGKSTCLKLLTRIIEPTTGSIEVTGRVSALLELGAGFHPDLTGRDNVFLYGSVLGLRRREMARRFDDIVSFAELERFIDVPTKFYSSGMYVRLAFATAINVSPDVLLVDEVLAVGDQSFQAKCLERIQELKARGVTIVLVSHSLDAVRTLCDRAIWLDRGILREDGLTDLVVARYLQDVYQRDEMAGMAALEAVRGVAAGPEGGVRPTEQPDSLQDEQERDRDPLARSRRHWGSREAEIADVYFLDKDGRKRLSLTTGEPMVVVVRYRASMRIERPMFRLAIHRNDGLQISAANSVLAGLDLPFIEGEGEVCYAIDVLPLVEGTYYVTAGIYDATGTHAYDHRALFHRFRVRGGVVTERYGAVYVPARWEHLPGPGSMASAGG